MPIALPGPSGPDSKYTTTLEGQAYEIRLRWNNRSDSWFGYLGLSGVEPTMKTRLTVGRDLLTSYRGIPDVPPGRLYVVDKEKGFGRPSYDDFGLDKRFELIYVRSFEEDLYGDLTI